MVRVCRPRSGVRRKLFGVLARERRTVFNGEFDSGSERTLAAWIRHASRTGLIPEQFGVEPVANGCVTRESSA